MNLCLRLKLKTDKIIKNSKARIKLQNKVDFKLLVFLAYTELLKFNSLTNMTNLIFRKTLQLSVLCTLTFLQVPITLASNYSKDVDMPIETRVNNLLEQMTLEEKLAQLQTVWQEGKKLTREDGQFDAELAKTMLPVGIGHFARPSEDKDPLETVRYTNAIQSWLVENTRLGIPAIFHEEALHGHAASKSTSFPQAIALASTWSPELVKQVYQVSAEEVRARGGNQALTPILDVARDARWGRIEETMGEDPYLITALGVAAVKGFQGEQNSSTDNSIPKNRVIATLKHLTGHGQPLAGLNIAPAPMGERELREVFLPPFEAAVKLANVRSVMASYNEIDGVPSHANKQLLTDILRDEWKFDGVLVSDYFAINELVTRHGLAETPEQAAKMALMAGVDIEMPDRDTYPLLGKLVKVGKLDIHFIDQAVRRVLADKFRLGLFENPYTEETGVEDFIGNQAHRDLALKTAEKAITLLKNDGLLPLSKNAYQQVAVIGPHADETLLGGYSDIPRSTVTILDGIRTILAGKAKVKFAQGTLITKEFETPDPASIAAKSFSKVRWNTDQAELADEKDIQGMHAEALELVEKSDLAIVIVGGNEATSREGWAESHLGDRSDITLLGQQQELVEAILSLAKPTVVILSNGRPLALGNINDNAQAIVEAWYLGQETGTAIAKVLFGDVNPSGKLPVTLPRSVGQLPMFYNHKPSAKRGYAFGETSPMYAFGHGLSYTSFSYSDLSIDGKNARVNGWVDVTLKLENTGKVFGEEVVQFYVRDNVASTTRPVKELKGFKRVALEPGKKVSLHWRLPVNMLAYYDQNMNYIVDSGEIKLMIGSASDDIRLQDSFEIKGESTLVTDSNKAFLSEITVHQ